MTIEELYQRLNGNYPDVRGRFHTDDTIEKFILMFPGDDSITLLRDNVKTGDYDTAFRGVHTLCGHAGTFGFTELEARARELTEQMRGGKDQPAHPADTVLLERVEECYDRVVTAIEEYRSEKDR